MRLSTAQVNPQEAWGPARPLNARQHEPRPLGWRRRCRGAGSNCRHADFQSAALPLSYLGVQTAIVAMTRRRCQASEARTQPACAGTAPGPMEAGKALPSLLVHGVAQARQEAEHSNGDQQSANGNGKPGECPDQNSSVRHPEPPPRSSVQALQFWPSPLVVRLKAPHRVFELLAAGSGPLPPTPLSVRRRYVRSSGAPSRRPRPGYR